MADIPDHMLDKRIVERNIHRGAVNRKDFDKYVRELPDTAENADSVSLDEQGRPAANAESEPSQGDGQSG